MYSTYLRTYIIALRKSWNNVVATTRKIAYKKFFRSAEYYRYNFFAVTSHPETVKTLNNYL